MIDEFIGILIDRFKLIKNFEVFRFGNRVLVRFGNLTKARLHIGGYIDVELTSELLEVYCYTSDNTIPAFYTYCYYSDFVDVDVFIGSILCKALYK